VTRGVGIEPTLTSIFNTPPWLVVRQPTIYIKRTITGHTNFWRSFGSIRRPAMETFSCDRRRFRLLL